MASARSLSLKKTRHYKGEDAAPFEAEGKLKATAIRLILGEGTIYRAPTGFAELVFGVPGRQEDARLKPRRYV